VKHRLMHATAARPLLAPVGQIGRAASLVCRRQPVQMEARIDCADKLIS